MTIGTQVAEINETVANWMIVIRHRPEEIAKLLDIDMETERKIRDVVKVNQGSEVILEIAEGSSKL